MLPFLLWLFDALVAVAFWLMTLCAVDIHIHYHGAPDIHLPGWSMWLFGRKKGR